MHREALDHITDLDVLRRMVLQRETLLLEKLTEIADREAQLVERQALVVEQRRVIAERDDAIAQRDHEIHFKSAKIEQLTLALAVLRRLQFAARSEHLDPAQQVLFDTAIAEDIASVQTEIEKIAPPEKREHSVPKRQVLPAQLPRVEERIEAESCTCGQCGGALHCIGEEVSEKLDIKPVEFFVRRTTRPKLACRACETVVTTPTLPAIIERGIAAPGMLAHVLTSKYVDHLPLYRQCEMLARSGITLSRTTLSEWVGACGVALQPLVDELRKALHQSLVLHADETPIQMLDPGAGKTKRTFLFAYRQGEIGATPIIVFDFAVNRSGSNVRHFLEHYGGALVVDDYSGYKQLFKNTPMREIACWAHARRKFFELHAANKSLIAAEALTRIGALYAIEREAKDMDAQARQQHRLQHAKPKIEALFQWLRQIQPKVSATSGTGKAIHYLLRRTDAFTRYLDDGRFPVDNNPVENAIRPIALGRKNWLFAGSERAGHRAAAILSLIATAKANGHDPHSYLRDVLTRLPTQLNSQIAELLPHIWQPRASDDHIAV